MYGSNQLFLVCLKCQDWMPLKKSKQSDNILDFKVRAHLWTGRFKCKIPSLKTSKAQTRECTGLKLTALATLALEVFGNYEGG